MSGLDDLLKSDPKNDRREVVRIRRSFWSDKNGIHMRLDLIPQMRKSTGVQLLQEDAGMSGTEEVFPRITNLQGCKDGLYLVETCNEKKDWETGYVEEYDYKLVPYEP